MTLSPEEMRRALTPLERSVLSTAGRLHTRDPLALLSDLRRNGVCVPIVRRMRNGEPQLVRTRGLTLEDVTVLLEESCRKLEAAARQRAVPEPERPRTLRVARVDPPAPGGKSVTLPPTLPRTPERSDGMEASAAVPAAPPEGGFVARINEEAQREVARVLRDLQRLRFEAHQVEHVLRALKLPVPEELVHFINWVEPSNYQAEAESVFGPEADEQAARDAALEPAPAPDAPDPGEEPTQEAETPPEPAARRRAVPPTSAEWPEHLAPMPSAQGKEPKSSQIAAAEKELAVLQAVNQLCSDPSGDGTVVINEVMEVLGGSVQQARASKALGELAEYGLIRETGKRRIDAARRARGGAVGKAGKEYAALDRAPAAEAPAVEEALEVAPEALAAVRDFVCSVKDAFTVAQVMEVTKIEEAITRKALQALIQRSVVNYVGMDDLELYEYSPPTTPGRAAELDAQRGREPGMTNGSGPVAGTGRQSRSAHKATNDLLTQARRAGGEVTETGSGHFAIGNPRNGKRIIISSTPASDGQAQNKKRLRGIGLEVA